MQAAKDPSSDTSEWTSEPTWQYLSGLVRRHKNRYADLKKEWRPVMTPTRAAGNRRERHAKGHGHQSLGLPVDMY